MLILVNKARCLSVAIRDSQTKTRPKANHAIFFHGYQRWYKRCDGQVPRKLPDWMILTNVIFNQSAGKQPQQELRFLLKSGKIKQILFAKCNRGTVRVCPRVTFAALEGLQLMYSVSWPYNKSGLIYMLHLTVCWSRDECCTDLVSTEPNQQEVPFLILSLICCNDVEKSVTDLWYSVV